MKKTFQIIVAILIILAALAACASSSSNSHNCALCNKNTQNVVHVDYGAYICHSCAIVRNYLRCKNCGDYYVPDYLFSSDTYCSNCYETHAYNCFLCWSGCTEPIKLIINNTEYYICNICATQYFANVEPIKPCYSCIECGKVFGGAFYEHSVYTGAKICEDCLDTFDYDQCSVCKKYDTELVNGLCGLCSEINR